MVRCRWAEILVRRRGPVQVSALGWNARGTLLACAPRIGRMPAAEL